MKQVGIKAIALVGSVLVHFVAWTLIVPVLAARPPPQQATTQSQLALATVRVERNRVTAQSPVATAAEAMQSAGARIGSGGVARTYAPAMEVEAPLASAKAAAGPRAKAQRLPAQFVPAQSTAGPQHIAVNADAMTLGRQMPVAVQSDTVIAQRETGETLSPLSTALIAAPVAPSGMDTKRRSAVKAVAFLTSPIAAPASTAAALPPTGTRIEAGFEWSGAQNVVLDSQSVATLAAFLQPGAPEGRQLRDQMAEIMAAPPCARIHTVFDPLTGTMDLRGHVPDAAARAPLLAALRRQMGDGLPLRDMLRILPEPQCGVLDGIAALGLPQSEEQLTDSDLVGENAQVREYAFFEGDRLSIDLSAPDYPAYIYVDYFDALGQVIHLRPNALSGLERVAAEAVFSIGRGDDIDLRIAPPFGQDIAVAFATSVPLYDGLRPLIEPAAPYLAYLRQRVERARQSASDFRGEWAYLFVATGPVSEPEHPKD